MTIKLATFVEDIGDRESIQHGGVTFKPNEAVEIDTDEVDLAPWFVGNSSFRVEDVAHEATPDQTIDVGAGDRARDGDQGASEVDQPIKAGQEPDRVKPVRKARKKVAAKV